MNFGFGFGGMGGPMPSKFEEQYHCYSVAYADKSHLEVRMERVLCFDRNSHLPKKAIFFNILLYIVPFKSNLYCFSISIKYRAEIKFYCLLLPLTHLPVFKWTIRCFSASNHQIKEQRHTLEYLNLQLKKDHATFHSG